MTAETIKKALAPCGLSCEKCFAYAGGEIQILSRRLQAALGNFDAYAKRFETLMNEPVFNKYPDFKVMLAHLASENCQGCRSEACKLFENCGVRRCHRENQVDFCFQCDQFPCDQTNFDRSLYQAWVIINRKIKKIGIESYYEKTCTRPRYP